MRQRADIDKLEFVYNQHERWRKAFFVGKLNGKIGDLLEKLFAKKHVSSSTYERYRKARKVFEGKVSPNDIKNVLHRW